MENVSTLLMSKKLKLMFVNAMTGFQQSFNHFRKENALDASQIDALKQELNNRVKSFLGVDSLSAEQQAGFGYQLALMDIYDQLNTEQQKAADIEPGSEDFRCRVSFERRWLV